MHICIDGILGDGELSDDPTTRSQSKNIRKQIGLGPVSEDADAAEHQVRLGNQLLR